LVRLGVIFLLLLVLARLFHLVVGRMLLGAMARAAAARGEPAALFRRRADTLAATLNWAFNIFLIFLGVGLVLAEIDVNVSALIAGVGVVGIALGLGA